MEALKQVENLVSTKIAMIKTVFTLFRLEARLAGLSVFPLVLNIALLLIGLMTTWLFLSVLVGYGILLASDNFFLSLVLVFLLNLGVVLFLVRYLTFNIKNMSFAKTRAYFSSNESMDDEQKKIDHANSYGE